MVELLLALPVVLMLGLGIVQFTLVYQGKHALDYALTQAARLGAVEHASSEAIVKGFAAGLVPYLYGARSFEQLIQAEGRAAEHVRDGSAAGWIDLRQRSPTLESFEDWAEPALDPMGEVIPGLTEIPNDNLDSRRTRMQPTSGTSGTVLSEPVGQRSGQTLADANLLRLELIYGVRLAVPVVGPLIIRTMSRWNGCSSVPVPVASASPRADDARASGGPSERLGLLLLGAPQPLDRTQPWICGFLEAGRIPVRTAATMRMMSTARRSGMTQVRADVASGLSAPVFLLAPNPEGAGGQASSGDRDQAGDAPHSPPATTPASPPALPSPPRGNRFLGIGGDRPYGMPGTHPALCPV